MAGTISSAGIGSGLDVSSIITKLMAVEQAPLQKLQATEAKAQAQLSTFGQMQSLVSAFRDAAAPLYNADNYALTTAASSDPTSVSAGSTTQAVPGSYSVAVSKLASTQTLVSAAGQFAASTSVVGTGSITLRLGSWSAGQAAFTPKTGSSDVVIPIGAGQNTLTGIRDAINAANAGVSATIVTDATGARLSLQSSATGADNGFRVTVADSDFDATTNPGGNTDATGLSALAFDPPGGAAQMSLAQSAANTQATINGIAVSTTGTQLSDVVEGLSFSLSKVTTAPVTVTVSRNTDSVKARLNTLVSAYNALSGFLAQNTSYDAANKKAALLQGDSTAVGLQGQLRAQIGQAGTASSTFASLSSIGLELQKDGSLKLNETKLTTALKNPTELQKALGNIDTATPAMNGLAKKLASWADKLLAADGTLPGKTKSIQARITSIQKDQERVSDRLALVEQRLRAQYNALDTAMSKANALSQYVQQQVTTWNKSTG